MTRAACALALVAGLVVTAAAWQSGAGGHISGVVVSADSAPQPVRRAVVTLGGAGADGHSVITDDQGRFAFVGLPAGRFTLTASKPAFLANAYGAKAPGRPGTPVTLAAGETRTNLTLILPRGAVIAGTVRDFTGEPASSVAVYVIPVEDADASHAVSAESAVTDERGDYRAFGLPPGVYLLAAAPRSIGPGDMTSRSVADVDEAIRAQQQIRSGIAPGRGTTPAAPTAPATPTNAAPKPRVVSYAPTFSPGTAVWSEAARITVGTGEEQDNVDIRLEVVAAATVDGLVVNAGGDVPEMSVTLSRDGPTFPMAFGLTPSSSSRPGAGGSNAFKFTNVAPGHYTMTARTSNTRTTYGANGSMSMSQVAAGSVPMYWAQMDVDVTGEDLTGLTLQVQPAITISGRVAFDATTLTPPMDLTTLRVNVTPASVSADARGTALDEANISRPPALPLTATLNADGTFQVLGLMPGRYAINSVVPGASGPSGWWLASAMLDGHDALDSPLDISAGHDVSGAVLTFSDRHASLSGALKTPSGQPATDYLVIVFPVDHAMWRAGSRREKSARPASDGQFSFADLPPGDYLLAAVTDAGPDEWQRPEFLEGLVTAGVPITLGPGDKKVQSLQIAGGGATSPPTSAGSH